MTLPAHAITPCDTRQPPRPAADHPVNTANRERSMRVLNLALQIADQAVQSTVESNCDFFLDADGTTWFEIGVPWTDECVQSAIRYIELRDPDSAPWRFTRHPDHPHLVRFEAKP